VVRIFKLGSHSGKPQLGNWQKHTGAQVIAAFVRPRPPRENGRGFFLYNVPLSPCLTGFLCIVAYSFRRWLHCRWHPQHAAGFTAIDITGANIGPDYQLSYSDGKPASLRDFKGKYVMLFFGFTQCPDVCPTTLSRATEIKRLLGADGDKLQVVFVTVDPERDTGPLLAEYMRAFDPTFVAVRGNAEQTAKAAKDFKIFTARCRAAVPTPWTTPPSPTCSTPAARSGWPSSTNKPPSRSPPTCACCNPKKKPAS
jgi:cytochrome oxidase Cu insertion factor (SCO1/SenC/PrrC family)